MPRNRTDFKLESLADDCHYLQGELKRKFLTGIYTFTQLQELADKMQIAIFKREDLILHPLIVKQTPCVIGRVVRSA